MRARAPPWTVWLRRVAGVRRGSGAWICYLVGRFTKSPSFSPAPRLRPSPEEPRTTPHFPIGPGSPAPVMGHREETEPGRPTTEIPGLRDSRVSGPKPPLTSGGWCPASGFRRPGLCSAFQASGAFLPPGGCVPGLPRFGLRQSRAGQREPAGQPGPDRAEPAPPLQSPVVTPVAGIGAAPAPGRPVPRRPRRHEGPGGARWGAEVFGREREVVRLGQGPFAPTGKEEARQEAEERRAGSAGLFGPE